MVNFTQLDNPVWHALTTRHGSLALARPLAARYPGDVSPLVGLAEPSDAAFADLLALMAHPDGQAETVGLFTTAPLKVPAPWQLVSTQIIDQMVCTERPFASPEPSPATTLSKSPCTIVPMQPSDVPDMLALTAATKPGPFLPNTISMGSYLGVRSVEGQLVAMAGQRLRLVGFTEISAVCTDPKFRGKGYAKTLIASLANIAFNEGRTPFLHVKTQNEAKIVYTKLGFAVRRPIHVTVIRSH